MPLFFSGREWLVLEGKDTSRIKVFGSLHLLCFHNNKSEIGERSLKWNGMRDILQTQWLRIAHDLQAVLKARPWRCSSSFSSLFSKPSIVKAFIPTQATFFTELYALSIDSGEWPSPVACGELAETWALWVRKSWFQFQVLSLY